MISVKYKEDKSIGVFRDGIEVPVSVKIHSSNGLNRVMTSSGNGEIIESNGTIFLFCDDGAFIEIG